MHKQRLAVIIAAALGVVATLLPWGSINMGFLGNISLNGFQAGGWIPFILAAGAGVMAFLGDDRSKAIEANMVKGVAGAGGAIVLFMIWKVFIDISVAYASIGAFLMLIAGLAILAVPFVIKDSGEFEMPTKESIKDEFNEMKDN